MDHHRSGWCWNVQKSDYISDNGNQYWVLSGTPQWNSKLGLLTGILCHWGPPELIIRLTVMKSHAIRKWYASVMRRPSSSCNSIQPFRAVPSSLHRIALGKTFPHKASECHPWFPLPAVAEIPAAKVQWQIQVRLHSAISGVLSKLPGLKEMFSSISLSFLWMVKESLLNHFPHIRGKVRYWR